MSWLRLIFKALTAEVVFKISIDSFFNSRSSSPINRLIAFNTSWSLSTSRIVFIHAPHSRSMVFDETLRYLLLIPVRYDYDPSAAYRYTCGHQYVWKACSSL